tara:strand:- start:3209 stop:3406 length:198 start_codon:yes stop_codon:yes gene_type:complete
MTSLRAKPKAGKIPRKTPAYFAAEKKAKAEFKETRKIIPSFNPAKRDLDAKTKAILRATKNKKGK